MSIVSNHLRIMLASLLPMSLGCGVQIRTLRTSNLAGTNIPDTAWNPSLFDFGAIDSGPTGEQIFTLTNSGTANLMGCVSPQLSNTTDFAITADTCGINTLAAGATCTVSVQANPTSLGSKSSTLMRRCANGVTSTTLGGLTTSGIPVVDPFGTCSPTGYGLTPGTTTLFEDYNAGAAPTFNPAMSGCWRTFQSSLNPLLPSDYGAQFVTDTFNGISLNMRKLSITGRSGVESNLAVKYSPYSTPGTGWNSGQFPYLIDMYRNPNCYADVTVTAKLKPNSPGYAALQGLIVNGTITGSGYGRRITGYLIHGNGGGDSLNLALYRSAYDRAFDFVDLAPSYNGRPNPQSDGPAQAWDYNTSAYTYPAGGQISGDGENTYAAHYRYDSASHTALVEWEVRGADGVDHSPGTWDYSRTLTGTDALIPAGGYGIYMTYYGGVLGASATNAVENAEMKITCVN